MNPDEAYDYLKDTCDERQMEAVEAIIASKTARGGRRIEFQDERHRYQREYMKAYRKKNLSKMREYNRKYQREYNK